LLNSGIVDVENFKLENAFPNPSHGLTCIPVHTSRNIHISLSLKNILGEEMINIYKGNHSGDKKYFINTASLPAGVYLIELNAGKDIMKQKLIVR
jgi:hypothetical protein